MARGGGSGGRSGGGSFGGSRGGGGRSGGVGGSRGGVSGVGRGSSSGGGSFGGTSGGLFGGNRNNSGPGFGTGFLLGRGLRPSGGYGGGYNRAPRSSSGGGCGCITLIVIIIFLIVIFSIVGSMNSSSSGNITVSSVERVALPPGSVNETKYYTDKIGWIGNETKLISGLRHFYKETGVQPYIYLTDTINGSHYPTNLELQTYTENLYDELFTDEAHVLLVFFEYDGSYMDYYLAGTQAKSVIDTEAGNILLDYIDRYYYEKNLTEEEFFSKSFSDAADRIMTVTRSPWITVFIVLGVVVLIIILFIWWKKHKEQENLEAKRREEILNTPLDSFGSTEAEDLMKKYQDDNDK